MKIELSKGNGTSACPNGTHNAVCVRICDLGLQPGYNGGPSRQKIVFLFETELRREGGAYAGRRHQLSKIVSASQNPKSNLVQMLKAWRGHDLKEEERRYGIDTDVFVGMPCTLTVIHEEKNGEAAARIAAVSPHNRSSEALEPEHPEDVPEWVTRIYESRIQDERPKEKNPALREEIFPSDNDDEKWDKMEMSI